MKKRYYYICMLSVLLLMLVLPTKAASEAEFGKRWIVHPLIGTVSWV